MTVAGRSRILGTVRHPGPAHCVAAAIRAVPDVDWHLAAHPLAARVLAESYPDTFARVSVVDISVGELEAGDTAGLSMVLDRCARLFDDVRPDAVVRTTPATGWGPDELVATAVAGRVPVIALQDFPGIGTALRSGAHPVGHLGADVVLAPDDTAAGWLRSILGVPAAAVGWLAHDRFHRLEPYDEQRAAARASAGLASDETCVLVIGSGPDVARAREEQLVVEAAGIASALSPAPVRCGYRPHPRRPVDDGHVLQGVLTGMVPTPPCPTDGFATLAMADVVVSRASVMNLELMAYAATWSARHVPLSAYVMDEHEPFIAGYWGPERPPTHRPGGGSLVVSTGLGNAVAQELFSRTGTGRTPSYVSDPDRTRSVLWPLFHGQT